MDQLGYGIMLIERDNNELRGAPRPPHRREHLSARRLRFRRQAASVGRLAAGLRARPKMETLTPA